MNRHHQSMWQRKHFISNCGKSGNLRMQTCLCWHPGYTDNVNYSPRIQKAVNFNLIMHFWVFRRTKHILHTVPRAGENFIGEPTSVVKAGLSVAVWFSIYIEITHPCVLSVCLLQPDIMCEWAVIYCARSPPLIFQLISLPHACEASHGLQCASTGIFI